MTLRPGPSARSIVVDAERRIVESSGGDWVVGGALTAASWLGRPALEAIEDAALDHPGDRAEPRVGCDDARGTHWLLSARRLAEAPWRVRVEAIDVTRAVAADRAAVLGKIVHATQNICFALQSAAEAIEMDRPTGARMDEYLVHLRTPVERFSATMSRLNALLVMRQPASPRPVRVAAVVADALRRASPSAQPKRVTVDDEAMAVHGDPDLLAEVIVSMLESEGKDASSTLDVDATVVAGRPYARVVVDRRELAHDDQAYAGSWDLASSHRLDTALRLATARGIVLAHGGTVSAESAGPRRVRLVVQLPQLDP